MIYFSVGDSVNSVHFGIGGHGDVSIHGSGRINKVWGTSLDIENADALGRNCADVLCSWQIANSSVAEVDVDGMGFGVWKKFQQDQKTSLGQIAYYENNESEKRSIAISIIMCDASFERALRLFELNYDRDDVFYMLHVAGRIRNPDAKTESPTVKEFMSGLLGEKKAIITEKLTLGFTKEISRAQ